MQLSDRIGRRMKLQDLHTLIEAYLYLMRQSYGTGQVLVVDGGALLV